MVSRRDEGKPPANTSTPARPGRVTVAGKPSDDLAPGTLNSIRKQAGLKEKH
jgi:hypothetical protein